MIVICGIIDDFENLPRKHGISCDKFQRIAFTVVKALDW
jgi:hypothetical protein